MGCFWTDLVHSEQQCSTTPAVLFSGYSDCSNGVPRIPFFAVCGIDLESASSVVLLEAWGYATEDFYGPDPYTADPCDIGGPPPDGVEIFHDTTPRPMTKDDELMVWGDFFEGLPSNCGPGYNVLSVSINGDPPILIVAVVGCF